jgi:hypothetical protein
VNWSKKVSLGGSLSIRKMTCLRALEARDGKRGLWGNSPSNASDFQYPGTLPSAVLVKKKSHVYRYTECKNYNAMLTQKNVVKIDTVEDAVEAGYHPANDCPGNTAKR